MELKEEEINFIKSLTIQKKEEDYLYDMFIFFKKIPFRYNSSKNEMIWDSNQTKTEIEISIKEKYDDFMEKPEVIEYKRNNQIKISMLEQKTYKDKIIKALDNIKANYNIELKKGNIDVGNSTIVKNNFYLEILGQDKYKEIKYLLNKNQNKHVYNNELLLDSKDEAFNYKDIFIPLINNGIKVIIKQPYNKETIDLGQKNDLDFYIPELDLYIESSSYQRSNKKYYNEIEIKNIYTKLNNDLKNDNKDFIFLNPHNYKDIEYSKNQDEIKEIIIYKLKEKGYSETLITKLKKDWENPESDDLIEKYNSDKHKDLEKYNSDTKIYMKNQKDKKNKILISEKSLKENLIKITSLLKNNLTKFKNDKNILKDFLSDEEIKKLLINTNYIYTLIEKYKEEVNVDTLNKFYKLNLNIIMKNFKDNEQKAKQILDIINIENIINNIGNDININSIKDKLINIKKYNDKIIERIKDNKELNNKEQTKYINEIELK